MIMALLFQRDFRKMVTASLFLVNVVAHEEEHSAVGVFVSGPKRLTNDYYRFHPLSLSLSPDSSSCLCENVAENGKIKIKDVPTWYHFASLPGGRGAARSVPCTLIEFLVRPHRQTTNHSNPPI